MISELLSRNVALSYFSQAVKTENILRLQPKLAGSIYRKQPDELSGVEQYFI